MKTFAMDSNGRRRLKILHTSDLHLATIGDGACNSLVALVSFARQVEPDLVIVAGDLFDHNRVNDKLVSFAAEQFRRFPVDVRHNSKIVREDAGTIH